MSTSNSNNKLSSTVQLVIENKEMEDRLKSLKKVMAMEKIQRSSENAQGKKYWKSSQSGGPLHTIASVQNGSFKKRKLKILTGNERYYTKDKVSCGQCNQYKASIACVECIENYCTVCFTKFHQKGALSNHHVRPLDATLSQVKECSPVKHTKTCSTGTEDHIESQGTSQSHPSQTEHNSSSSSLLDGTYDEEASSKSFQDALLAWRNSRNTIGSTDCASMTSCGIQTVSDTSKPTPNINFTSLSSSKLSYMERLLLQKKRSNPSFFKIQSSHNKVKVHEAIDKNSTDDDEQSITVPSEHNLFYSNNDTPTASVDQTHCHNDHPVLLHGSSSVVIQDVKECLVEDDSINVNDNRVSTSHNDAHSKKKEKTHERSATKIRRKEPKPKKKVPKKPCTDPGPMDSGCIPPYEPIYKGLAGFFLVDSTEPVLPANEDDTSNTRESNELQSTTTTSVSMMSSLQTQWIPMSSIPSTDNNTQISSHDVPPHCVSSNNAHLDTTVDTDTDSGDDTVIDDDRYMMTSMTEHDDEDTAVLEDLGRELVMMSQAEQYGEDSDHEEEEVDVRALSRMTIEELVEEFEEYQTQVMSNED